MKNFVSAFAIVLLTSGCATSRGVIDLETPVAQSDSPPVAANAPAVFLNQVVDNRTFELKPPDPSTPSLKDGRIDDIALTSRAIARKRNGYGKALGDVMLPEGKTVSELVRENVQSVLESQGYRVIDQPEQGAAQVEVDIQKFWAWFTPGFWAAKIEFKSELELTGALPGLSDGAIVTGYAHQKHQAATGGAWIQTMQVGLEDLRANMAKEIGQASTVQSAAD